ncbi:MAG: hypothetical protein KA010_01180 [Saprospiraceae bacterium]|nr:hypothetical protein [Saprospiraceae bacterium]
MKNIKLSVIYLLCLLAYNNISAQDDDLYYNPNNNVSNSNSSNYDTNNDESGDYTYYDEGKKGNDGYDDNYMEDYNDYDGQYYSSRIKRFHRPTYRYYIDIYDPWYYDPFYSPGYTIVNYNNYDYFTWRRWNRWNMCNSWGFNNYNNYYNPWSYGCNSPWSNPWSYNSWNNHYGNYGWNNYYYGGYYNSPYYGNGGYGNWYGNGGGYGGGDNHHNNTVYGPRKTGTVRNASEGVPNTRSTSGNPGVPPRTTDVKPEVQRRNATEDVQPKPKSPATSPRYQTQQESGTKIQKEQRETYQRPERQKRYNSSDQIETPNQNNNNSGREYRNSQRNENSRQRIERSESRPSIRESSPSRGSNNNQIERQSPRSESPSRSSGSSSSNRGGGRRN